MGVKYANAARLIKEAFYEGWSSFNTPCNPYSSDDDEWEKSSAKVLHDQFMDKATRQKDTTQ